MMKKIWNFLVSWGEAVHAARTATALSRQGRYEEAKRVVSQ